MQISDIELWIYRFFGGILMFGAVDYMKFRLNIGKEFRMKDDCEKIAETFRKENREDHEKMSEKLDKVVSAVSRLEGEVRRMNGNKG